MDYSATGLELYNSCKMGQEKIEFEELINKIIKQNTKTITQLVDLNLELNNLLNKK